MVCIAPRDGENVHQLVDRLVGEGVLVEGDADAVHDFADYLHDTAVHGAPSTWGPNLLRRHRRTLGLTDGEITAIENQLGAGCRPGGGWPGE